MSRRCDLTGKDGAGRPQGEPLQPQDQAAVPAQPAQRHHDVRHARPLGAASGFRPTRCKTVDHRGGLDAFLLKAKDDELSPRARDIKREIQKKQAAG